MVFSPFPRFHSWMSSSALSSYGVSVPKSVSSSSSGSLETFTSQLLTTPPVNSYLRASPSYRQDLGHPVRLLERPQILLSLQGSSQFHQLPTLACVWRHFRFSEWMPGNLLIHAAAYFNLSLTSACFWRLSYIVNTWVEKIFSWNMDLLCFSFLCVQGAYILT